MTTLTPAQRQQLKGLAHGLEPVVLIGNAGLSEAVLKEIDASLKAHELIKVKAAGAEREDRNAWLAQICEALGAQPVQHIGKTLVIYRENPDKAPPAPVKKAAAKPKGRRKAAPATLSEKPERPSARPRARTGENPARAAGPKAPRGTRTKTPR